MSNREYMSCADTAKMIRQVLKESFPANKFSVKSKTYSGGASITVRYVDGPAVASVKGVLDVFEASYFDGMIDYKGARYHSLDGKEVRFGADFIFVERELTKATAEAMVSHFSAKYGRSDWVEMQGSDQFGYRVLASHSAPSLQLDFDAYYAEHTPAAQASATLARVKLTGDDGYGAGTIGPDGSGKNTANGYPRPTSEATRAMNLAASLEKVGSFSTMMDALRSM